jgi:hypothetical protein
MQAKPHLPTFQVLDVAIDAIQLLAPVVARIRPIARAFRT